MRILIYYPWSHSVGIILHCADLRQTTKVPREGILVSDVRAMKLKYWNLNNLIGTIHKVMKLCAISGIKLTSENRWDVSISRRLSSKVVETAKAAASGLFAFARLRRTVVLVVWGLSIGWFSPLLKVQPDWGQPRKYYATWYESSGRPMCYYTPKNPSLDGYLRFYIRFDRARTVGTFAGVLLFSFYMLVENF